MKDLPLDSTDLTWLASLARALLREPHAADDLAQETALAAIEGPLPADVPRRAWLGSVARRLAARRFRSEARRHRRETEVARPEVLPDSGELVERAEIAERVTAAARRLPEPYRRTILLRFLEGRSSDEIAREEGKPVDTVRWRVRRGLELLREDLVQKHDRDWSSWCALLLPLARSHGDVGLATAGASGAFSWTVVSLTAMKATLAATVVLGCVGWWMTRNSDDGALADAPAADVARPVSAAPTIQRPEPETALVQPSGERSAVPVVAPPEPTTADPGPAKLSGRVVDEQGDPIAAATVYLIPSTKGASVRTRTESDWRGEFRFTQDDWKSDEEPLDAALVLGVTANGFLRKVVPDVLSAGSDGELVVTLERGRTLTGRVEDESGRPVPDLELLAYDASAGIAHVSPSQRRLRAERSEITSSSSGYQHCRATTDGYGRIEFTGLSTGTLNVLPLDPGWTIESSRRVDEEDFDVVWTAKRRLGVRLVVVDRITGRPIEKAAAIFCMDLTFANGEEMDLSQWVGRGAGEVSFVLDSELLPGLEERTITRATFYGTARAEDGEKVSWIADPIENEAGAVGVATVRVEVDPAPIGPVAAGDRSPQDAEVAMASLILDVRYDDSAPFDGELRVNWRAARSPTQTEESDADAIGLGRYRVEVPADELTLEVAKRFSSGSLPSWTGTIRCYPDQEALAFVTLPRGAATTITRPEGWGGEWFVQTSWRPDGTEEWQADWGYSTAESSMTLTSLRPAEWRFELRQYTALDPDPLVRTALLEEGETTMVDE